MNSKSVGFSGTSVGSSSASRPVRDKGRTAQQVSANPPRASNVSASLRAPLTVGKRRVSIADELPLDTAGAKNMTAEKCRAQYALLPAGPTRQAALAEHLKLIEEVPAGPANSGACQKVLAYLLTLDPLKEEVAEAFEPLMLNLVHRMCGPDFGRGQVQAFVQAVAGRNDRMAMGGSETKNAWAQLQSFHLLGRVLKSARPDARISTPRLFGEASLTAGGARNVLLKKEDIQAIGMQANAWKMLERGMQADVVLKGPSRAELRAAALVELARQEKQDLEQAPRPATPKPPSPKLAGSRADAPRNAQEPKSAAPSRRSQPDLLRDSKHVEPAPAATPESGGVAKPRTAPAPLPPTLEDVMKMPVTAKADVDGFYQAMLVLAYREGSKTPRDSCARLLQEAFSKFRSGGIESSQLELIVSALAQSVGGPQMQASMATHLMNCIGKSAGDSKAAAECGVRALAIALAVGPDFGKRANQKAALEASGKAFRSLAARHGTAMPKLFVAWSVGDLEAYATRAPSASSRDNATQASSKRSPGEVMRQLADKVDVNDAKALEDVRQEVRSMARNIGADKVLKQLVPFARSWYAHGAISTREGFEALMGGLLEYLKEDQTLTPNQVQVFLQRAWVSGDGLPHAREACVKLLAAALKGDPLVHAARLAIEGFPPEQREAARTVFEGALAL